MRRHRFFTGAAARVLPHLFGLAVVASVLAASGPAMAQSPTAAQSEAQYQRDRAACASGAAMQDTASCLREAAAARDARSRGMLSSGSDDFKTNAAARCEALPGDQRQDCLDRVHGGGSSTGSVGEGGILRESVTRETQIPPQPPITPVVIPDEPPNSSPKAQ